VVRQARSGTIPIHFLSDFLKITKECSRVFNIAVRGTTFSIGIGIACHTPLTV